MYGQEKLINFIDTFNKNTFPHSVLLLGEEGSGQVDICRYIADKFDMLDLDITNSVSHETIENIMMVTTEPTIYTIEMNKITEREQNILLKFYEEPNIFTYIILIAETTNDILETILNRSYTLNMCKYTKDQLKKKINNEQEEIILNTCHTPGQIEIANHTDMLALYTLCTNMLEKIKTANFFNTLTISDKINFKDEYSKYDLKLFIRTLLYAMKETSHFEFFDELIHLNRYIDYMNDKKSFFEHFLLNIWRLARDN